MKVCKRIVRCCVPCHDLRLASKLTRLAFAADTCFGSRGQGFCALTILMHSLTLISRHTLDLRLTFIKDASMPGIGRGARFPLGCYLVAHQRPLSEVYIDLLQYSTRNDWRTCRVFRRAEDSVTVLNMQNASLRGTHLRLLCPKRLRVPSTYVYRGKRSQGQVCGFIDVAREIMFMASKTRQNRRGTCASCM